MEGRREGNQKPSVMLSMDGKNKEERVCESASRREPGAPRVCFVAVTEKRGCATGRYHRRFFLRSLFFSIDKR